MFLYIYVYINLLLLLYLLTERERFSILYHKERMNVKCFFFSLHCHLPLRCHRLPLSIYIFKRSPLIHFYENDDFVGFC